MGARRLENHLVANQGLCPEKHEFLPKSSFVFSLLLARVSERVTRHPTDLVLAEFTKPFYRVPNGRSLKQLRTFIIGAPLLHYTEDFLLEGISQ